MAELSHLPVRDASLDIITCNMVVEHLDAPIAVFREFARALRRGGRVLVHTPNVWSHFVLASRFIPRPLKLKLIKALDQRRPEDVFPTRYRANSSRKLRRLMERVGLKQVACRLLASDATLALTHPVLAACELLYIRMTLTRPLRHLRLTILATFVKP